MRKIIILIALIMLLISSVASADKIDDRWFWVSSNSKQTIYVDKETIEYNPATDTVTVWSMINVPSENWRFISKNVINYKTNSLAMKNTHLYNLSTNEHIREITDIDHNFKEIIPGTDGEIIRDKCASLVNRDMKLKEYQDAQAKAQEQKEQEEQERINKEHEAQEKVKQKIKQQQTVKTAIGIIGGLIR